MVIVQGSHSMSYVHVIIKRQTETKRGETESYTLLPNNSYSMYMNMFLLTCRYAFDYIIPRYDANQSLRNTSISLTNGIMTMSFVRDIISDDSDDISINKCVYILSSWGGSVTTFTSPAQFNRHTATQVFTTQICLDQCTSGKIWCAVFYNYMIS